MCVVHRHAIFGSHTLSDLLSMRGHVKICLGRRKTWPNDKGNYRKHGSSNPLLLGPQGTTSTP